MKSLQLLIIPAILSILSSAGNAAVDLVRDGRPLADIIVETNALSSVRLAASDLQEYIEKISGARLELTNAPSDQFKNHVYVGPSEFTKKLGVTVDDLKPEGFKIIAKDNYVVLIGRDEQRPPAKYPRRGPEAEKAKKEWRQFCGDESDPPGGGGLGSFNKGLGIDVYDATATFYAATELLEQLGVRFYHPYENGTVVPGMKDISVPEQNLAREPKFPCRQFTFYRTMELDAEGVKWFKRLKFGSTYEYYNHGHSTRDILTPDQEKIHPEYYAVANGQRIPGRGNDGVPRLMSPEFRKASINYMNKSLEAYPKSLTFCLGMPDGFTQIDERDAKTWDRPDRGYGGKFSDYVWDYWLFAARELKKTHPDKFLTCFSYTTYAEPPAQVDKLPDNIAIAMLYGVSSSMLPEYKFYKQIREKWIAMLTSKKMFIFEHLLFYRKGAPTCPAFYPKLLQEEMRYLNGICEGKHAEIMPWKKDGKDRLAYPGLTHMLHYLQGKLYWDPDLDLKKLYDEYYELYFGPARTEMKEFYEFAEEVWTRPETRSITIVGGFLKEKDVDRYFDILKRAREKAGRDSIYDQRIAEIESEIEPLKKLFSNLQRTGPEFRCYEAKGPVEIDGNLDKPLWNDSTLIWYTMRELVTGEPIPSMNAAKVAFRLTPDKSALIIGVQCMESKMDNILAKANGNDNFEIFNGDVVEIYIETPERSFFKVAVNPNGSVWDECRDSTIVERDTLPLLWNPGIKAAVKKEKDSWSMEVMIPTKDFGSLGPRKPYPWGINVCRARYAGGEAEVSAISPTGQRLFAVLTKLGNLYIE